MTHLRRIADDFPQCRCHKMGAAMFLLYVFHFDGPDKLESAQSARLGSGVPLP